MGHLLYLMFRCDRGCDGKFGKCGNFVETKHTHRTSRKYRTDRRRVRQVILTLFEGRRGRGGHRPTAAVRVCRPSTLDAETCELVSLASVAGRVRPILTRIIVGFPPWEFCMRAENYKRR